MKRAMKRATGSIVTAALLIGFATAAHAQTSAQTSAQPVAQPGGPGGGVNGGRSGGSTATGVATGPGAGAGTPPTPAMGMTDRAAAGPALNNMRANGTSLNANPNPRAPNLGGKPSPPN